MHITLLRSTEIWHWLPNYYRASAFSCGALINCVNFTTLLFFDSFRRWCFTKDFNWYLNGIIWEDWTYMYFSSFWPAYHFNVIMYQFFFYSFSVPNTSDCFCMRLEATLACTFPGYIPYFALNHECEMWKQHVKFTGPAYNIEDGLIAGRHPDNWPHIWS